jgi:superoxide reductase
LTDDLFADINRADDLENLSDLEKKHLPVIDAPDSANAGEAFEVTIDVGKLLKHPNEPGHHIQWISLFNGGIALATIQITPVATSPNVTFRVSLGKTSTLRAVERCNLHGEWEYSKKVMVV